MTNSAVCELNGQKIAEVFGKNGIDVSLVGFNRGAAFTLFEFSVNPETKVSHIWKLENSVAAALSVENVRFVVPIPGKEAIGVEVPNKRRRTVQFSSFNSALKKSSFNVPIVLGKDVYGKREIVDLAMLPHLLIAGRQGSGKTAFLDSLICSVLKTKSPEDVKLALIDLKGAEYHVYNGMPNLLVPVITDPLVALEVFDKLVEEIEWRIFLFSKAGAKKIDDYNRKVENGEYSGEKLPYIVAIVDEYSSLMLEHGKRFELQLKRILAVARFCGIHLVLSTNKCSADVITGVIKSNFPSQIAFAVPSALSSRIVIDQIGAEELLDKGDMLFCLGNSRQPVRLQGALVKDFGKIINPDS